MLFFENAFNQLQAFEGSHLMENRQLTYKGLVYPWHCDHMGHMNVMWYVGKFDEATWAFFANIGLSPAFLRDSGTGMAATEQHLTYQREAMPGDMLEIFTELIEVKNKILRFSHEMRDVETGEITATCELVGVHLDTTARKSIALPEDVREKALAMIAESE